jgi:hypothetical protein
MLNYKPKESNYQRQILDEIKTTNSPLKDKALFLSKEADNYLIRAGV